MTNKDLIKDYAIKNTSKKLPIERKIVESFLDALLNSSTIDELENRLLNTITDGNNFILLNSLWQSAGSLNIEPYQSIIAYSMLKKDKFLFELIGKTFFNSDIEIFFGTNLYTQIIKETDEIPTPHTDTDITTDIQEGLIHIGFKATYSQNGDKNYLSIDEIKEKEKVFNELITVVKPARVGILMFYTPHIFFTWEKQGDDYIPITDNIKIEDGKPQIKQSPITLTDIYTKEQRTNQLAILANMSRANIEKLYRQLKINAEFTFTRDFDYDNEDYTKFTYHIKLNVGKTGGTTEFPTIEIKSTQDDVLYIEASDYRPTQQYYQKYIPTLIKISENSNDVVMFDGLPVQDPSGEYHCEPRNALLVYQRERRDSKNG